MVAVGRTGRVDRAEGRRELGGWRGCVAWTKGMEIGEGGGGGYRCSLEVGLTGLARLWMADV